MNDYQNPTLKDTTLIDLFAGLFMVGYLAGSNTWSRIAEGTLAKDAYDFAGQMLAERDKVRVMRKNNA